MAAAASTSFAATHERTALAGTVQGEAASDWARGSGTESMYSVACCCALFVVGELSSGADGRQQAVCAWRDESAMAAAAVPRSRSRLPHSGEGRRDAPRLCEDASLAV